MKLTETDIRMFESLHKSELGSNLVQYIQRLQAEICDVRNWGENDTKESAQQAAKYLQNVVDRIRLQNDNVENQLNAYD